MPQHYNKPGPDPLEMLMGPMGAGPQVGPGMSPAMEDPEPPMPMGIGPPGMGPQGMAGPGGAPPIPGVRPGAEGRFMELLAEMASLMEPQGPPGMPPPGMGPPQGPPGRPGGGAPNLMELLGGGGGRPPRPPR